MAGTNNDSSEATATPSDAAPPAIAGLPVTASPPDYRITLPPLRSPHVAQLILLGGTLSQLGLALLITIYLARVLTAADFGFFSLVATIFILARKFLDLGLSNVAARDIADDTRRERPILEGMMAYRRVAGVVLALVLCVFALMQRSAPERAVLLAVGWVLLFTEPAALDPVFQVRQAQAAPALLNVFGGLLVLGGSVAFKRLGIAGAAFGWLLIVRESVTLMGTKLLAEHLLGYHPKPGFRGRALKAFVRPALIFGLASLVYTIYFNCDVFFVYALRGQEELGAYAAAFRPINPLLLLPWLLMVPLVPVLTVAAKDRQRFVSQVKELCGFALGLGACASVAGVLLARDLVTLLYRGRYLEGPLSCINALRWLAVALGLVCVTTVLTAAMLADRKEKLLLEVGVVALGVNAAMNLVLLHLYNFTAAGFTTAVTELLFLGGALTAFDLATHQSALTWDCWRSLLPAAAMGVVLYFMGGGPAIRVVVGIALGLLSAVAILSSRRARQLRKEMAGEAALLPWL
ncbi:MAG: oligosaccharide flippase family protein [Candidatus Korobacteraceae bacterium]